MATSQQPYIALGDLKAYLNISDTDSSQDMYLANLCRYVQGYIDRYTGRTFGWGDAGDSSLIDYSNTDNLGIQSSSLLGNILTIVTMGPVPWKAGQDVSVFNTGVPAYEGVWEVTDLPGFNQISVDISVSKGTLSPSDSPANTNMPASNFGGYIGNYVTNYRYISQEQHDGIPGKTFYLRNMDIRSIDTLYVGLRNISSPALLDHSQYVWRNDGRVIRGGAYFNSVNSSIYSSANDTSFYGSVASGFQTITISYWVGYIGVPPEVQMAALDMCAGLFAMRRGLGVTRERVGDYEVWNDVTLRKQLEAQPDTFNVLNTMRRLHI